MQSGEEEFETWWREYPKKLAKGDARKAWKQTARIRPELSVLLSAIENAKQSEQWMRDAGQYIPYPATWLRGERWEDEHEVEVVQKDTRPSIVCSECKQKAFTWMQGKCNPCWRKYMGMAA